MYACVIRGRYALKWPGLWFEMIYRNVFGQRYPSGAVNDQQSHPCLLAKVGQHRSSASSRDPRLRLDLLVTDRLLLLGAGGSGVAILLYISSVSGAALQWTISACRLSVY